MRVCKIEVTDEGAHLALEFAAVEGFDDVARLRNAINSGEWSSSEHDAKKAEEIEKLKSLRKDLCEVLKIKEEESDERIIKIVKAARKYALEYSDELTAKSLALIETHGVRAVQRDTVENMLREMDRLERERQDESRRVHELKAANETKTEEIKALEQRNEELHDKCLETSTRFGEFFRAVATALGIERGRATNQVIIDTARTVYQRASAKNEEDTLRADLAASTTRVLDLERQLRAAGNQIVGMVHRHEYDSMASALQSAGYLVKAPTTLAYEKAAAEREKIKRFSAGYDRLEEEHKGDPAWETPARAHEKAAAERERRMNETDRLVHEALDKGDEP
jgi:hypothetical protein